MSAERRPEDSMPVAMSRFEPLPGIFEPSGVQQLPDGRFLVIEDEKEFPFCLLALNADGRMTGPPVAVASPDKLSDLEGLTLGPSGHLYAITSHSRDGDAEVKKSRRRLVRFRVVGDAIVDAAVFDGLLPALTAAHPALAAAAQVANVKEDGGLNIEALEMAPDGKELLVGLRGPVINDRAAVAVLAGPDAVFDGDAPTKILIRTVDLGGQGIRSMAWVAALRGYLVVSGPLSREKASFGLWLWDGTEAAARRVSIQGVDDMARTEGVTGAQVGGKAMVLLVSDDGDRSARRPANHLLIDVARLLVAP
jgi:hypothetical protein